MTRKRANKKAHFGKNLVAIVHLDFEGRSVGENEIVCSHSRVDCIDRSDTGFRSWNEASDYRGGRNSQMRVSANRLR